MGSLPLEDALVRRVAQGDFGHQCFKLSDVFCGYRFMDEHPTVGLAMLSTIVIDREMGAEQYSQQSFVR